MFIRGAKSKTKKDSLLATGGDVAELDLAGILADDACVAEPHHQEVNAGLIREVEACADLLAGEVLQVGLGAAAIADGALAVVNHRLVLGDLVARADPGDQA